MRGDAKGTDGKPDGMIGSPPHAWGRLRPDGEKGPLTAPLAAFDFYYELRAQLWEFQSLTRARAVCGNAGDDFIHLARDSGCVETMLETEIFVRSGILCEAILDSDARHPARRIAR